MMKGLLAPKLPIAMHRLKGFNEFTNVFWDYFFQMLDLQQLFL